MDIIKAKIEGNINSEKLVLKGKDIKEPTLILKGNIVHGGNYETYKGLYDVIPNFTLQTLETFNKLMTDDVRVHEIPVYKTENIGGGYTVVIGGN